MRSNPASRRAEQKFLTAGMDPRNQARRLSPDHSARRQARAAVTRNGHDWSDRYPLIVGGALQTATRSFVIDGEAVLLGSMVDRISTVCIRAGHQAMRCNVRMAFVLWGSLNGELAASCGLDES